MKPLPIDASRLLANLAELRTFGAVGPGVARSAFSDADVAARRRIAELMRDAGLEPVCDPCGNLFGLPPDPAPSLLMGSHSDSQPRGGWLDGIFGVLAALEVARAARMAGGPPVAVVSFQDEEGWYGSLLGSTVWTGARALDDADALTDVNGQTFGAARARAVEIAPVAAVDPARFRAFIEPHIEQGPVLHQSGEKIGVVDAIVGMRSFTACFVGEANHAGTTPMPMRRDAVQAMARFVHELNERFSALAGERTVWTSGRIEIEPNAPSIVPAVARVAVQMRDPERDRLEAMLAAATDHARVVADALGLGLELRAGAGHEPCAMDPGLVDGLAAAAEAVAPGRWRKMPSGALHDALNVAAVMPATVMFVPSIGGISHSPAEDTAPEDLANGLAVLAEAAVRL